VTIFVTTTATIAVSSHGMTTATIAVATTATIAVITPATVAVTTRATIAVTTHATTPAIAHRGAAAGVGSAGWPRASRRPSSRPSRAWGTRGLNGHCLPCLRRWPC
jgi:hypothetical protein